MNSKALHLRANVNYPLMLLKTALLALSITLFAACHHQAAESEKTSDTTPAAATETREGEHHETATPLLLNHGAKWQADENTRSHVAQLQAKDDRFSQTARPALSGYKAFADTMQQELNALIKDCKMKGPEHEALHQWLAPVVKEVKNMQTAPTEATARQAKEKLTKHLQQFNQYFN